jgi:hypothetical protein
VIASVGRSPPTRTPATRTPAGIEFDAGGGAVVVVGAVVVAAVVVVDAVVVDAVVVDTVVVDTVVVTSAITAPEKAPAATNPSTKSRTAYRRFTTRAV